MIKLHARVTKEIEITDEQAERLVNYLCGCDENSNINDILQQFTKDITSGDYDDQGYISYDWIETDLLNGLKGEIREYFNKNCCRHNDIDL